MLKVDRAKFIVNVLDELYPSTPVPLNNKNNFELLVAVLLSAQCTDERVNKVTPSLFSIANNPFDMQDVDTETIYKIIRPCGLAPQKSKAISKAKAKPTPKELRRERTQNPKAKRKRQINIDS